MRRIEPAVELHSRAADGEGGGWRRGHIPGSGW